MRRLLPTTAAVLLIAGCGGPGLSSQKSTPVKTMTQASGQRSYLVKLPNGKVVVQAHDPKLAEPSGRFKLSLPAAPTPTVEMYDSVTVSTIPSSAHYVAGYVNGRFQTWRLLRSHPVDVGISVASDFKTFGGADCFDMEPGNPTPSAAGPWARWQLSQGNGRPCEYSMLSWMPAIRANLAANHVATCSNATQNRCVRLWDANWTFVRHLDAGFPCTQWTDHSGGVNRDESTCATWFYKRTVPKPKPKPKPLTSSQVHFNQGFQRGYTVHWLRKHHRKVPALGEPQVWFGHFRQQGYNDGYNAVK